MITIGVMNAAAHVITLSVYGLDDAFSMVKLYAGSSVDGMTFGNREPNSSTTVAMTATVVSTNAHPSISARVRKITPINAAAAAATRIHVHPLPYASWVHSTN